MRRNAITVLAALILLVSLHGVYIGWVWMHKTDGNDESIVRPNRVIDKINNIVSQSVLARKKDTKLLQDLGELEKTEAGTQAAESEDGFSLEKAEMELEDDLVMIPHKLWFTNKEDIFKTKRPRHFYLNVLNTTRLYTEAFQRVNPDSQPEIRSLDNVQCLEIIQEAWPSLAPIFENEIEGPFKGDMCRTAALYLHGGYYFDIDMEVVQPFVAEAINRKIRFASAYDTGNGQFFQSFIAVSPSHPIMKEALRRMVAHYENKENTLLGPATLADAFNELKAKLDPESLYMLHEENPETLKRIKPRLETLENQIQDFLAPVGRGLKCSCVLIDKNPRKQSGEPIIVYFKSRIVGSSNCPFVEPGQHATCGLGKVGNGVCDVKGQCCSKAGYCGDSIAYCKAPAVVKADGSPNKKCGNGFYGDGECENPSLCCSFSGYCGDSPDHCVNPFHPKFATYATKPKVVIV